MNGLLSEAEEILASAGSPTPFPKYSQDTTPVQRKVTRDYVARIRETMRRQLAELGIPPNPPVCGALWAVHNLLNFASIAVAELEPKRVRGYGELSEADTLLLNSMTAELNAVIDRLNSYLGQGAETDLQKRLARLEKTTAEIELLRQLERVITAHGIVECRGALAMLLDRIENHHFEIGVFGRVSSGKSSLLNYLLEDDVLPTGVTPVTAFPTRISFQAEARAVIEFAETQPMVVELPHLEEYSTEQHNPGNEKHVARIRVEMPARRLREGVTFVDTPGLGSLATTGAEETVAYLPRCDLGLVLIDAGSTLTHEDLTVVQALCQAGATAMVLISKADLLSLPDRRQMADYTANQLSAQLNLTLPVHLVSVVGAGKALCDHWLEKELMPLVEGHREQAAGAFKRKVGSLREAVVKVLENRLQGSSNPFAGQSLTRINEATAAVRNSDVQIEAARRNGDDIIDRVSSLTVNVISIAAADLAEAWAASEGDEAQAATVVSQAINRVLTAQVTDLAEMLRSLRLQLEQALQFARQVLSATAEIGDPLPLPTSAPMADLAILTQRLSLKKPVLLGLLGSGLLRRHARARLGYQLQPGLQEFLNQYSQSLRQWFRQTLLGLRKDFDARAGLYRAQLEGRTSAAAAETGPASVEVDLRRLREWPAPVSSALDRH